MRKKICIIILFCALCLTYQIESKAQNKILADSLIQVYSTGHIQGEELLLILKNIASNVSDPATKLYYANILMDEANEQNSIYYRQASLIIKGASYSNSGQIELALDALFEGAEIAERNGFTEDLGAFYGQIASVYGINNDLKNSLIFKKKSLNLFVKNNNVEYIGYASLNIGYDFYNLGELDSSLFYYAKAKPIFEEMKFDVGLAYVKGNTALVTWKQGDFKNAEIALLNAIEMLEPFGDSYGMADYLNNLARLYYEQNNIEKAIEVSTRGIELAKKASLNVSVRDASLLLSQIFEKQKKFDQAHFFHKQYVIYKDSIQSIETSQKMADQRTQFEVGQKQVEVDLLTAEKRIQRIILFATAAFALIFIVLASIIYRYYRSKNKINRILARQKIELEDLNETKDKFFSIISHDIRGPVASFQGIGHLIKFFVESKETNQLLEVADHIDQSVDQLSKLLDNLLAWAMQQQGSFPNVPEKLDLNEISNDLVKTLGNMAESKKITLTSTISESIHLWADKNSTMTILRNLVNNSLKFTPEGGSVTIAAKQIEGMAEISVSDTGVGIPKEKLDKLFKLQDKKSTYGTSGEKGLGLGLQLVYEFMEMNNGSIEVESEEGKGTTFIIRLPLFESEHVTVKA
jgi:signal transduction histidine kinase